MDTTYSRGPNPKILVFFLALAVRQTSYLNGLYRCSPGDPDPTSGSVSSFCFSLSHKPPPPPKSPRPLRVLCHLALLRGCFTEPRFLILMTSHLSVSFSWIMPLVSSLKLSLPGPSSSIFLLELPPPPGVFQFYVSHGSV